VGALLLDRDAKVLERRVAQTVEVEEQVVEVQPLGTVERACAPGPLPEAGRHRRMPLQRLRVVFVLGSVEGPAVRPDEGRVEVRDRVVLLLRRGGRRSRAPLARCGRIELPAQVRMDGPSGLLKVADRLTGDVLDDRLQAPARAPPGRCVGGHRIPHAGEAATPEL
jgi:hypothetical protein